MIKLPIEIGDTILGGKFRNHKIVVKEIGKDEWGHPTINGKPILKIRIEKFMKKTAKLNELKARIEKLESVTNLQEHEEAFMSKLSELKARVEKLESAKRVITPKIKSLMQKYKQIEKQEEKRRFQLSGGGQGDFSFQNNPDFMRNLHEKDQSLNRFSKQKQNVLEQLRELGIDINYGGPDDFKWLN